MSAQPSYYLNLIKVIKNRFLFNLKNFGAKLAFINFASEICDYKKIRNTKLSKYMNKKREKIITTTLEKKYAQQIEKYKNKNIKVGKNSKKIWFMRWNGIENEHPVIKKCFKNIEKNCGEYEVILITKDNYLKYCDLPPELIKRVEENIVSLTHLSEILRTQLLSKYGGVWVDSTMFICDNIFNEFDDVVFNSPHSIKGTWCGFFMGGKPNKLFSFLYEILVQYHLKYDETISYFLMDHLIRIAYNNFEDCREYIDSSTLINPKLFYLLNHFSDTYNEKDFNQLCNDYKYFKISDKDSVNAKDYDENGKLTNYGYFKYQL